MTQKITVNHTSDEYECEYCGSNYNEGIEVFVDGKMIYEEKAIAHCYDGSYVNITDVVNGILKHFNVDAQLEENSL